MQCPRRHRRTGFCDPDVKCRLGLTPTREPGPPSAKYAARSVRRAARQQRQKRGEEGDLMRDPRFHSPSADEEPLFIDLLPSNSADFFPTAARKQKQPQNPI